MLNQILSVETVDVGKTSILLKIHTT